MKTYELIYIAVPELKIEEIEGLTSEINTFLQKEGGIIIKMEGPNPKTLAYPIKKRGTGFQVDLEFNFEPEKVKSLEEKIRKDARILRHLLIVKKQPKKEKNKKRLKLERKPVYPKPEESFSAKILEEETEKKVELKDIEKKLEEILKE